jgi:hypothetical protein
MADPNRYQPTLDNIANDLRRWHQNVYVRSTGVDHLYTRDLILASDRLEDMIEDIGAEEAYVRLKIGQVAAIGTRITSAPMQMLYALPAEAVPYAVVALDHVEPLHWVEAGRRVYERHFGNGVISFTARQLAVVLNDGANLSISALHEKPDYWSFEKPGINVGR